MNRITHQLGNECYISCYHGFLSTLQSILAGGSVSFVVAVVEDDAQQCRRQLILTYKKKRFSLKDITNSKLVKPPFLFVLSRASLHPENTFSAQWVER